MFLRHDSYAERMDELNGSSPASVGSNQGLDLSPTTSQRTSPAVPSNTGSPSRRNEDQLMVPGVRESKFLFNMMGGALGSHEGYSSPRLPENINSPLGSDTGSATVSAKIEPIEAQDEALNMSVVKKGEELEEEPEDSMALSASPSQDSLDLRQSPLEQSEINMSYLHRNNLLTVSHSMT